MNMRFLFKIAVFGLVLLPSLLMAQTTEFTYQGKLNDGASAANASYDFEFRLFDAAAGGTQVGSTMTRNGVAVSGGIFSVNLDFGSSFPGADRFLEIAVRPSGDGSFMTLAPRQRIASAPYSVKTLNADNAATAGTATNSQQLGGVAADQYVRTTDARLTDPRAPTAGSENYVQNTTTLQPTSNFNISGTGSASILSAATEYRLGGERTIATGSNSLFLGGNAGQNSTASNTLFIGRFAGQDNTGSGNIFIGDRSGRFNTGSDNTFVGSGSGTNNTSGGQNSFFGHFAGLTNTTGAFNAFFGEGAGQVNNANSNSFFGYNAGRSSTGANNVFVGSAAGAANITGSNNTLLGQGTNLAASGLMFASAVGSGAVVSASNTVVLGRGIGIDTVEIPGALTVGIGITTAATRLRVVGTSDAEPFGGGLIVAGSTSSNNVAIDNNEIMARDASGTATLALNADGGNVHLIQSGTGNVGIGTTSPDQKLSVNGNASKTGGTSWAVFSDERLKNISGSYTRGIEALRKLQPIRFEYRSDNPLGLKGTGEYIGFSAQDVQEVLPEAVTTSTQGYLQLNADPILWTMLNGVKEQQAQIEEQKAEIELLKKRVALIDDLMKLLGRDKSAASVCKEDK